MKYPMKICRPCRDKPARFSFINPCDTKLSESAQIDTSGNPIEEVERTTPWCEHRLDGYTFTCVTTYSQSISKRRYLRVFIQSAKQASKRCSSRRRLCLAYGTCVCMG